MSLLNRIAYEATTWTNVDYPKHGEYPLQRVKPLSVPGCKGEFDHAVQLRFIFQKAGSYRRYLSSKLMEEYSESIC